MRKSDVVLLMLISIKGSVSQRHFLITVIYYYNIFLISLRIFHIVFSLALLFLQCLQITCLADDNVFAGLTPCNNPGQIICATCLSQNGIPYNWVVGTSIGSYIGRSIGCISYSSVREFAGRGSLPDARDLNFFLANGLVKEKQRHRTFYSLQN